MTVTCVVDAKNRLGEVPVWDVAEQALYWVDIEGRLLQRLTPATGKVERWEMPERIACFALRETGGLIVAFASGIAFYDLDTGGIEWIARPDPVPTNRFNEGKCDRRGRFWAGTMDDRLTEHSAALFRVDPDLTVTKVLDGIGISNSIVWSLDDREFYFADTLDGVIDRFDFDARPRHDLEPPPHRRPQGHRHRPRRLDHRHRGLSLERPVGRLAGRALRARTAASTASWSFPSRSRRAACSAARTSGPSTSRRRSGTSRPGSSGTSRLAGGLFALDVGIGGVPEPRFAG